MLDRLEWMSFFLLLVDCWFFLCSVSMGMICCFIFVGFWKLKDRSVVFFACTALFARHFFDGTGWSVPRGYATYKPLCVKLFMNVYLSPAHALISNLVVMHFYGYLSVYLLDVYVYIVCFWLCSMDLAGILFLWGGLVFWALWFICSIILGREMVLLRCPYWYRTKGLLSVLSQLLYLCHL